jgi:hypothetical protein
MSADTATDAAEAFAAAAAVVLSNYRRAIERE